MESNYKPHTARLEIVDQYIRELFREELPKALRYHNADHTLHPAKGVVVIANHLAALEHISEHDRELLIGAAYFHDTGYIREYCQNEPIAARMAGRILKLIGYDSHDIEVVKKMILATDLAVEPETHCEKIVRDADVDNLGREDFFEYDGKLREERRIRGIDVNNDLKWYAGTLEFLRQHQYYTESEKRLREKGKRENIKGLLAKLQILGHRNEPLDDLAVAS